MRVSFKKLGKILMEFKNYVFPLYMNFFRLKPEKGA